MYRIVTRCVQMGFSFRDCFLKRGGMIVTYSLLIIMFLILLLMFFENGEEEYLECPRWKRRSGDYCKVRGCKVVCKEVDWRFLKQHLKGITQDYCDSELDITIEFLTFLKEPLEKGWLNFLNQRVKKLQLKNLRNYADFSSHPFQNLKSLIITEFQLERLEKNWFENLAGLRELEITCAEVKEDFWIEQGLLEGAPFLESIKISRCLNQAEQVANLTNSALLRKLRYVNLNNNRLRNLNVEFSLDYLGLHDNMLEEVNVDFPVAFLELSNNNLRKLRKDLFKYSQAVTLYGNPWECGCELQWLKGLYVAEGSPIDKSRPLVCADGRFLEDVNFDEMCFERREYYYSKWKEEDAVGCKAVGCMVTCTGVGYEYLAEAINAAVHECDTPLQLTLTSIQFPSKLIPSNWLKLLNYQVGQLELQKCKFNNISDDAFSGHPFTQIAQLTMVDPQIDGIRKTWFGKFKFLTTFELRYDSTPAGPDFWIELGSFGGLHKMHTLQLIRCLSSEYHIYNITGPGAGYLNELLTLDVRFNHIEKLFANSFTSAPKLLKLLLNANLLESIDRDAFSGTNLGYLEISDNLLKTIPEGVFSVFEKNQGMGKNIYASSNPWKCDCELLWFKNYCLKHDTFVNQTNPPLCDNKHPFAETEFTCDGTTHATTEEPTDGTTINDHEHGEQIVSVPCRDIVRNPLLARDSSEGEFFTSVEIISNNHTILITFTDTNDETTTKIVLHGEITNFHLLWFNTHKPHEKDCITKLTNAPIYLNNLHRTETYTFCLVHEGEKSVSPYSCFGATIPETWEKRAWLSHAQKTQSITIFAASVIATALVFTATTYFFVLRFPRLIKRNKRVVILGDKELHDSGYLTPNSPVYEKVNYRTRIGGNTISGYVTTVENSYNMQAPPLPPCHPVLGKLEEESISDA